MGRPGRGCGVEQGGVDPPAGPSEDLRAGFGGGGFHLEGSAEGEPGRQQRGERGLRVAQPFSGACAVLRIEIAPTGIAILRCRGESGPDLL